MNKKKLKKILKPIAKKNIFLRKIIRTIFDLKSKHAYKKLMKKNKTEKIIIFESFLGRGYSCSPKALYKEILNDDNFKEYKLIWAFRRTVDYDENEIENTLKYGSKEYYETYAKAKYWISNSRIPDCIQPREDQIYVQCWHGTPLKKLGMDIESESGNALYTINEIKKRYCHSGKRFTYMISPSKFVTEKYISAFNLKELNKEDIIVEKGYPRNDFLSNYQESDIKRIKEGLNIPNNKKVILYAPTWRDNQHTNGVGYTYKSQVDFDYLYDQLSDEYIILFRAHYLVANGFDFDKYEGFIYNVSSYPDINHLYVVTDLLITDYSSVFFDFATLNRPMIFYMYDLKEYASELRGFYIDLEELPGPIIEEEDELVNVIKKDVFGQYDSKYSEFKNKYTYLDDGNASKRVLAEIFKKSIV